MTTTDESSAGPPAQPGDQTIDELAAEAGIPVSTVRMYQNKKLLSPPERRGRVGYYGDHHRSRLRAIASLQERGFSLAAIREVFESWEAGRTVRGLINLREVAPSLARQPLRLTMPELLERFADIELHQADIVRAVELGMIELDGTDVVVRNAAFADIGPTAARLGIPIGTILDSYGALGADLDQIAERFRTLFETHLWDPFVADGMPADRAVSLTDDVGQLAELATAVVTAELTDRFAEFAAMYVERANSSDAAT